MVAKAVNNMLLWAALSADHEAIALTEAFDVDFARLVPALQLSSGSNWPLHNWEDTRRIPWAHKDMQQVLEMADEKGLSLPLSGLLREQVKPLMQKAGMAEGFIR
jgi:3-hydroxyisobutyrate dehydrogenase-like beta-hydroxyacid dehydrogenase